MPETSEGAPLFRRGDVRDAEAVLPVIESAFPTWPPFEIDVPTIDHLRWKMTPPEPLARDMHAIVEIDGVVVATQLRWPTRAHVRGEEVPSEVGGDLAVHQSAQGRGLSRLIRAEEAARLHGLRLAGYDTRPQNVLVRYMQEDDGSDISRQLDVWSRTYGLRALVRGHRAAGWRHLVAALAGGVAATANALKRSMTLPAGWRIESVSAFDGRADELWDRVRLEYDLARRRDSAWLNWRYLDPRAGRIFADAVFEGERLLGYVVCRNSHGQGTILDLVTDAQATGAGAALLGHGAEALHQAGCDTVTSLLPVGHREELAFKTSGFRLTGEARALQFRRERHRGLPEILEIAADPMAPIHVMPGEFDHG